MDNNKASVELSGSQMLGMAKPVHFSSIASILATSWKWWAMDILVLVDSWLEFAQWDVEINDAFIKLCLL